MKLFSNIKSGRRRSAFTLVEMTIAAGVYLSLFIGALIAIQVFALRVYTLAATKLTATQGSRKALNQMRDAIREGKGVQVGKTDNFGNFTACGGIGAASGNALQVFDTTNFSGPPYSIYFLQTNTMFGSPSNNLFWISVSASSVTNVYKLSTYITNLDVFSAQDCYGNTVSNSVKNNEAFAVKLQYYQWEYPVTSSNISHANMSDYYQLNTLVCRRSLD
jgi:hypothetical protein